MGNFLKNLELQGFKSFATKTSLEFPARVTAIVGPNGSGKSNVIDAMRWVLGEREAKQLRGDTLQYLIFSGTPKRAAQGFAKVSLYFDNAKKTFPLESPEVVVSRRVDRSGASEFAWNEMEVRLKDLLPVFARARLGARGLNMIGQGESDVFVRSNPEERRLMIEEILGLREFRIKKNQAERRLESSRINMEKVAAMLEELGPHLRMLRRQKNRFDKRSEIEKELHDLENKYFGRMLADLKREEEKLLIPLRGAEENHRAQTREIKTLEEKLKSLDKKSEGAPRVKDFRERVASKILEKSGYERELTRLETKREFSRDRKEPLHSAAEVQNALEDLSREMESWLQVSDI
ncbi:MAG: AAA family ATPase, partial [Patescibacteria group bacterium]